MNKLKLSFFIALIFTINATGYSQISNTYTLKEIIDITRNRSIWALQAEVRKENRYWQYRVYKSDYNPQLSLDGTFPNYTRQFIEVRQPDGSNDFKAVNQNNSGVNLRLQQSIHYTGTQVFVNSTVNRFDDFEDNYKLYSGDPVSIGLQQPLFQYNDLRWARRIEPLRYEESKREYVQELEQLSLIAVNRYFDLMLAQISFQVAELNLANNDTIYKIGQGRYNLGKIAENELLELELNVMNSKQQRAEAQVDLETSSLRLRTFTGLMEVNNITLILPESIPNVEVNENEAIALARKNRPDALGFSRRQLEAESEVAQARGTSGLNANMFASFGLSGRSEGNLPDMYDSPDNASNVRIGFQIPVLDWGRQKSRVKTAEANLKLEEYTIQLDEINFDEEIFTQVKQFKMLREQVIISSQADVIALKRYEIARNRYLIGKTSITDLNLALQAKDNAKRSYIQSLRDFWSAYYNIRYLTLYDFESKTTLYTESDS